MTLPLRKKRRITVPSFPAKPSDGESSKFEVRSSKEIRSSKFEVMPLCGLAATLVLAIGIGSIAHADDSTTGSNMPAAISNSTSTNGSTSSATSGSSSSGSSSTGGSNFSSAVQPKLVWRAARPQRNDGSSSQSTNDAKSMAVQNAHYAEDVFDDSAEPAPEKGPAKLNGKTTSGSKAGGSSSDKVAANRNGTTKIVLTAGVSSPAFDANDASDLPSVRSGRNLATDADDLGSSSVKRELPPMTIDAEPAHREPPELTPISPLRTGLPKHTLKTSQNTTPVPPTPQPDQPDLLPGADTGPAPRQRAPEEDCHEDYRLMKNYTLNKLNIDITPPAPNDANPEGPRVPYECALTSDPFTPRCWRMTTFTWKASALCHKPLYFEEVAMERYGHSHGPWCEDVTSFVHFFGNLALLPYWVGVDQPNECIYALGYYRAGNCAPYEFDAFPLSVRGAVTGAIGYGGVVALFP
jgi:hypothetical protein